MLITNVISAFIFGPLFYLFSTNKKYYNCDNQDFIWWCYTLGVVYLALLFVNVIFMFTSYILKYAEQLSSFQNGVQFIFGLIMLVIVIKITVNDDDQCGNLHILAKVYYILFYIYAFFSFFCLCCSCCIFGGIALIGEASKTPNGNGVEIK